MTNTKLTELSTLLENRDFVMTMLGQETPEDVQKLFADNGLELTMDEVMEIGAEIDRFANGGEELDEAALENVSGGALATAWLIAKALIAIGGAGLALYKWYKSAH